MSAQGSVFLGYCHPGEVTGLFHDSIMHTVIADAKSKKLIDGYAAIASGPRIANARTELCDSFLRRSKAEWLWMLDVDMVFPAETLYKLIGVADRRTRPIVGGLCFAGGRGSRVMPTLYALTGKGAEMERINDYPRDSLIKVDATGAACLLIHRSVLEQMEARFPRPFPWFEEIVIDGNDFGEDITFCLRANQLKIPIHVHTGARIGHVKTQVITEESYDAFREESKGMTEGQLQERHMKRIGMVAA